MYIGSSKIDCRNLLKVEKYTNSEMIVKLGPTRKYVPDTLVRLIIPLNPHLNFDLSGISPKLKWGFRGLVSQTTGIWFSSKLIIQCNAI